MNNSNYKMYTQAENIHNIKIWCKYKNLPSKQNKIDLILENMQKTKNLPDSQNMLTVLANLENRRGQQTKQTSLERKQQQMLEWLKFVQNWGKKSITLNKYTPVTQTILCLIFFNVCINHTTFTVNKNLIKQFAVHDSDVPVTLKQGKAIKPGITW